MLDSEKKRLNNRLVSPSEFNIDLLSSIGSVIDQVHVCFELDFFLWSFINALDFEIIKEILLNLCRLNENSRKF